MWSYNSSRFKLVPDIGQPTMSKWQEGLPKWQALANEHDHFTHPTQAHKYHLQLLLVDKPASQLICCLIYLRLAWSGTAQPKALWLKAQLTEVHINWIIQFDSNSALKWHSTYHIWAGSTETAFLTSSRFECCYIKMKLHYALSGAISTSSYTTIPWNINFTAITGNYIRSSHGRCSM